MSENVVPFNFRLQSKYEFFKLTNKFKLQNTENQAVVVNF